jgi:YVTN family beta-propeller protein
VRGTDRRWAALVATLLGTIAMIVAPAAASALTPFAYVSGSGPFAGLAVVNTATNTVVATVDTVPQTGGVASSPNGALVYATSQAGLSVVDTSTNAVVATIPVGSQPGEVVVSPNGAFAYVVDEANSRVTVVNTSSRTVVTTVPVGLGPTGIAISPNGTRVYVASSSNNVSVIDTASNTVVDTVPVGAFPEGVAVTPDGAFAYVANGFSDNVSVIDTASNTVVDTVPVGEYPFRVAVTPDGAFAYVTDRNGNAISVIDTATNAVVDTVPASSPEDLAMTPNGAFAYITNATSLLAFDISANAVVATIVRGNSGEGSEVAITPPIAGPVAATSAGPPLVKITSGPPKETANRRATFTFVGVAGGSYECSVDNGAWKACASGQAFGPLAPGDHRFRVRETLNGVTGPADSYRWTIDLPRKCVLRVARARVFVFAHQHRVRLVIHYTSYRFAQVTVSYALAGKKGALDLGEVTTRFSKADVFRLPTNLSAAEFARMRAAKLLRVRFSIPETPRSCGRYYTKRLTIPRKIFGQTVWFQSDSDFAPESP